MQNYFKNMTEHEIRVHDEAGNLVVTLEPCGIVLRCEQENELALVKAEGTVYGPEIIKGSPVTRPVVDGVPFYRTTYGEVYAVGLNTKERVAMPEKPTNARYWVVSGLVRAAMPEPWVVSPGPLLRDENGRPVGCTGLILGA